MSSTQAQLQVMEMGAGTAALDQLGSRQTAGTLHDATVSPHSERTLLVPEACALSYALW